MYIFPTKPLSPAGQHSDVSYSSVIDNVIATRPMAKYYLPSSAIVLADVASLVSKYGTTTTDHYPVFTQYSFSAQATLPVTLMNFTAVKKSTEVKLSWSALQDVNRKSFTIQRSADSIHFTRIGTVAAKKTSSIKTSYLFYDAHPKTGVNYYRLKQNNLDKKFIYSPVAKVNFAPAG